MSTDDETKSKPHKANTRPPTKALSGAPEESHLKAPFRFFIETLVALLIFFIIAGAAVLLSEFILTLQKNSVDILIVYGLKLVEYVIFFTDIVLFLRFTYVTALRAWRDM